MEQIRILMNNMGSQATDIINLLHEGNTYIVYLSSTDDISIKSVADEFYREKKFKKEEMQDYVDYLINICKEKSLNVFIPSRKMELLCRYKNKFEENNIKILVPDNIREFEILNNKIKTYELLKNVVGEAIPEHYLVKNLPELVGAVGELLGKNKTTCMKYVSDIACNSFRIINTNKHTFAELSKKTDTEKSRLSHSIDLNSVFEMFKEDLPNDLIVMEYMPGKEVSCDCLKTSKGNIIVPRIKINDKKQLICKDEKLMEYCNKILDFISYDTPCNIQFKYNENNMPMLLEINTRMSGGVMISSWASDINIPLIAIKKLIGDNYEFDMNWRDLEMIVRTNYEKNFI